MPINKLRSSSRARAAIAAVMVSAAAAGGYYATGNGYPPEVDLAIHTLIQPWEGRELHAYLDKIAKPPVWTICDGDTNNVKPGMIETPAGCNKRIAEKMMRVYYARVSQCIGNWKTAPIGWKAMMLSLSWNIGVVGTCNSTAARLGRLKQFEASCNAATAFNRAGGKVIIGIVRRRENGDASRIGEGELCVSGLPPVQQ